MVFIKVHVGEETLASVNCGDPIKKGIPAVQVSLDIILMDINIFDDVVATDSSFIFSSSSSLVPTSRLSSLLAFSFLPFG